MKLADRVLKGLSATLAVLGTLVVVFLMFATSIDVLRRAITGRGVVGVVEYSEIMMAALVFFGLAYAQRTDQHISVDLVVRRFPPVIRRAVLAFALLFTCAVLGWIAYHTFDSALDSFLRGEIHFGIASVPIWPARAVIPLGLTVMALECLRQLFELLAVPVGASPLEQSIGSSADNDPGV